MYVKLGKPDRKNRAETIVIHDYDTWNVDVTMAHIITPLLTEFRKDLHGAPHVYNEDVPDELRMSDEEKLVYSKNGETDDNWFKRWDYVINEMIWAFQQKLEEWEEQFASGENDVEFVEDPDKKDEEGEPMYKMKYGPKHNREYDWEGRKKFQARMSNGYKLFGKYYEGLWD
jgi:hypothetical protein